MSAAGPRASGLERPTVLRRVQELIFRRRHHVLAFIGLLTGVASLGLLRLEPAFDPRELVPAGETDVEARLEALFGTRVSADEVVVLVLEAPDVLAPEALRRGHALAAAALAVPGVASVDALTRTPLPQVLQGSVGFGDLEADEDEGDPAALEAMLALTEARPADFPAGLLSVGERLGGELAVRPLVAGELPTDGELARAREVVRASATLLHNVLLSPDGRRTLLVAHLAPDLDATGERAAVHALGALAQEDPAVTLGGLPAVRDAFQAALEDDPLLLILLAMLGNLVVLAIGFRRLGAVAIPLSAAGITLGLVLGGLGWAGQRFGVLHAVVPPLLITLAMSDAVHLLARFDEERAAGHGPLAAAKRAFRAMAVACFATSVTTAIGFGSLVLARTPELRSFAVVAALGVMVAYLVTILVLPLALPSLPARRVRAVAEGAAGSAGLDALVRGAVRHRRLVAVVSLVVFAGSLGLASRVTMDSRLLDAFAGDHPIVRSTALLEEGLGGVRRLEVLVEGERVHGARGERRVMELVAELEASPLVRRVTAAPLWTRTTAGLFGLEPPYDDGTTRALQALARAQDPRLARFAAPGASRLQVGLSDGGAVSTLALVEALWAQAPALAQEGLTLRVGGEVYRASLGLDRLSRDMVTSLGMATLVIFVMLAALFRSVRLGLVSIPPNVIPLAAIGAWMAVRGIPITASTAMVFAVSLGLVVDGTIHVVVRYREELARFGPSRTDAQLEAAIAETMRRSGRAVVLGALTLLLGFGALLVSAFEPVRLFAELSGVAIGTALLAELLLMPALLRDFGAERRGRDPAPSAR
ncbi:MAG: MMPL family transporter [Myxococcota bacterium]